MQIGTQASKVPTRTLEPQAESLVSPELLNFCKLHQEQREREKEAELHKSTSKTRLKIGGSNQQQSPQSSSSNKALIVVKVVVIGDSAIGYFGTY